MHLATANVGDIAMKNVRDFSLLREVQKELKLK
jgi:hypothetical protein